MAHDVRAVANAILDLAARSQRDVTNLALNKILYFLHAGFLHAYGEPLISAKIEAWDHGPVFREIYHQFKRFGRSEITGRAVRLNPASGEFEQVHGAFSASETAFIHENGSRLLDLSPGKLVDMSHVRDGPWYVARFGGGTLNPGVEITDDLILAGGKAHARH